MDLWSMIVLVVLIGCLTGVLSDYFKTRRTEAKQVGPSEEDWAEFDELRARVETLEKIVTEERFDLKKEIDRLERA